jgi:hypothetical protein
MGRPAKVAASKIDFDVEFDADQLAVFAGRLESIALNRSDGTLFECFLVYGKANFYSLPSRRCCSGAGILLQWL